MSLYNVGDEVQLSEEVCNKLYKEYAGKTLVVIRRSETKKKNWKNTNDNDKHRYLYTLMTEDGNEPNSPFFGYELTKVKMLIN